MGQKRQKVTRATRARARRQWPVRRTLAGAGVLAALGVLAACTGNAVSTANTADSVSHATTAALGRTAADRSAQSAGQPTIISRAIAHGRTARSAREAARKHARHHKAARPAGAWQPGATATPAVTPTGTPTAPPTAPTTPTAPAGTPSATPSATPAATPSATPSASQGSGDPSGQNPATTLSGFSLKYVQEFTGDSLPPNWTEYQGAPGGETSQEAQWEPNMCSFSGGEAHFMASGIDSCGMDYTGTPQEYGAFFARMKGNVEPSGQLFSDIFLLWPANNQWPPEIDIYEDEGDRSRTVATLWNTTGNACGASTSTQCLYQYTQTNGGSDGVANNGTEWHTYGVEWTPSGVSWLIDGRVVFTAPASQVKSPAQQPALPMNMALQSQNLPGSPGASSKEETMTVDWVEQFSWNG